MLANYATAVTNHKMIKKILILAANPQNIPRLRLAQEVRDIRAALQSSKYRDQFELHPRWAVRPRDIQNAMIEINPQFIHFLGHGKQDEGLVFEDNFGKSISIGTEPLANLFRLFSEQIECVLLSACYSVAQAEEIVRYIPYVIGSKQSIVDEAAIEFAVGFYNALGEGYDIQFAYEMGCNAIDLSGNRLCSKPILKSNLSLTRKASQNHINFQHGNKKLTLTEEKFLQACQLQVNSVITSSGHKYNPELYVNRTIENEVSVFLDSRTNTGAQCFLLVAPAGSGKTNLLCNLALSRVNHQPVILLLGGNCYLESESGLLGSIKVELESASNDCKFKSASDVIHSLHKSSSKIESCSIILIDAINEHENPRRMRKAIMNLLTHSSGKNIKFIITCRDYYWSVFDSKFWREKTINYTSDSDESSNEQFYYFSPKEHEIALDLHFKYYNISGYLLGKAREKCRHPLLLRFFCEAYQNEEIGEGIVQDIRLKELFDQYWNRKLESIAERKKQQDEHLLANREIVEQIGQYLLNLASYMLLQNTRAIPLKYLTKATGIEDDFRQIDSIFGRIRDEYIILEEKLVGSRYKKTINIAFVYEEFMEYAMARSLVSVWSESSQSQNEILKSVEKLTEKYHSFSQIIGVMVYLALMLKETHNIALWSLLLRKGPEWQNVVFEAIRKLPSEQLDIQLFDALAEMFQLNSIDIKIKILDILKLKRVGAAAPPYFVEMIGKSIKIDPYHFNCRFEEESLQISRRAVIALANMSKELAIPFIVTGFLGYKTDVSRNAHNALVQMGEPAVQPLLDLFKDRDLAHNLVAKIYSQYEAKRIFGSGYGLEVHSSIAEILGEIGDRCAIPTLVDSLKESQSFIPYLNEALIKLKWEPTDPAEKAWNLAIRGEFENCVKHYKKHAFRPLLKMLQENCYDGSRERNNIIKALGKIGSDETVDVILSVSQWLRPKGKARSDSAIIEALGTSGSPKAFDRLVNYLKNSRKYKRDAVIALGNLGDPRTITELRSIRSTDPLLKLIQVQVLRKLGDERAGVLLVEYLEDIKTLKKLDDIQIKSFIDPCLQDVDPQVRKQARISSNILLEKSNSDDRQVREDINVDLSKIDLIKSKKTNPLWKKTKERSSTFSIGVPGCSGVGKSTYTSSLLKAINESVDPISDNASEESVVIEKKILSSISKIQDRSNSIKVRQKATQSLGTVEDEQALSTLIKVLEDRSESVKVRQQAAISLGMIGCEQAIQPLVVALKDKRLKQKAIESLGMLRSEKAIKPLIKLLKDNSYIIRWTSKEALLKIGAPEALAAIKSFSKST